MNPLAAWWCNRSTRRRLLTLGLGLFLAALAWAAQAAGVFAALDRKLLDFYFVTRGERETLSPIVIVAIDFESLQRVEHRWPWPRNLHAQLIRKLASAGARVVAFDILFLDPDPAHDPDLARAAEAAGNVVWASTFVSADQQQFQVSQHLPPTQVLQVPSATFGYAGLPFDPDGYVRRMLPFRRFGSQIFKSFSVAVAERYRNEPLSPPSTEGKQSGNGRVGLVPTERDGSVRINFSGPPATFPIIPYVRVLEGKILSDAVKDKIVLVGATTEAADSFFTPFYSRLLPETSRTMPGVEIHANAVDMFLQGHSLRRTGSAWSFLLFIILGLTAGLLVGQRRPWLTISLLATVLTTYLILGYVLFSSFDLWLEAAGPVACAPLVWGGLAFYGFIVERKEKHFVRSTLELYVNPTVVEEVISLGIDLAPGGKRRTLTILFSDIRGFTGLSERLSPEVMVDILNQHFTASSEIILNSGGTLDKFIGDAIMAFWGAPTPREDHALAAVKVALAMQAAARELDKIVEAQWGEQFRIGVGINTGDAVVGHIGSPRRMGYTAVGDPTNLASRVEGLTKEYQSDILITQATYDRVKDEIEAESLGQVPVKGRKETTAIYRVIGLKENQVFS
jgi:adenylate cyclase